MADTDKLCVDGSFEERVEYYLKHFDKRALAEMLVEVEDVAHVQGQNH